MSEFVAGCSSGFIQSLIGHPLDTLKVLAQTSVSNNNNKLLNKASGKLHHRFTKLYSGVTYPTAMSMLTTGIIFDVNSRIHKETENHYKSGFLTGCFIAPTMYFFDTGKIYYQTKCASLPQTYYFPWKKFLNWNGLGATFAREALANSLYIGVYFDLEERTNSPLVSGGIAGLSSWCVSYPVDVIKTRQMTDCSLSFLNAAKQGYLWRGFGVCALRAVLVNAAGFWTYDYVKHHYH